MRNLIIRKNNKAILLRIITYTLIVIILYNLLIIGLTYITDKNNKGILGFRAYIITTESMKPNINPGDVVIIKSIPEEELEVNDIITFKTENGINTHRIIKIENNAERLYVIKGDNNNLEDENNITFSQILGKKIFRIPILGSIAIALQDEVYIIIVAIIVLLIYIRYQSIQEKDKLRREKKEKEDEKFKENN